VAEILSVCVHLPVKTMCALILLSPLGMPAERAICFACVFFSFFIRIIFVSGQSMSHVISKSTGPIFTEFSGLVDL